MASLSVDEIAQLVNGITEGDAKRLISGASATNEAKPDDLAFISGKPTLQKSYLAAAASKAGCLIVPLAFEATGAWSLVRVSEPRSAFAKALKALYPAKRYLPFIHPSATISPSASIAPNAYIGAHVSIGSGCRIESSCVILDGCVLGEDVRIGPNAMLHANVTVYDTVQIGANVIVHANAVIGADGFGFALVDGKYEKFPQVGTVIIHDDVEIGAGCCIDRAALGATRIGRGSKLDNLVHVAHNCVVGDNVVIAAQAGFAGSVTIGDYAVIGGQVGVADKAKIEAHAIVGAKSGITSSAVVHSGEPVWGIPARPIRGHLKNLAYVNKLPELTEQVLKLESRIRELERQQRND